MKKCLAVVFWFACLLPAWPYKFFYSEQFYELYHQMYYNYPERVLENIYWLEQTLNHDFCNPLYALAVIETPAEHERYRNLFRMHVNLEMVKQYRILAGRYHKQKIYYFNYPWKEENLKGIPIARQYYETALYYWEEAKIWSSAASNSNLYLEEIGYWIDENYRIETHDLDYGEIITGDLKKIDELEAQLIAMDENTF